MDNVAERNGDIAREFLRALEAKHVQRVLAGFSDDSIWISPEGTFTGKREIQKYLSWLVSRGEDMKVKECGNGTVVEDNRVFIEHNISYQRFSERIEYTVLCALEIKDGRINRVRTVYDRLSLGQKLARGRIARWAFHHSLKEIEKKLHAG